MANRAFRGAVLSLFLLAAGSAHAQLVTKAGIQGGVDFTRTTVEVSLPVDSGPTNETTFVGGGYFEASSGTIEGLWVRIGALYVQRKTTIVFSGADGLPPVASKYKIGFIDVPLLMKYELQPEPFVPYFFGGAQVGFRVSADAENSSAGATQSVDVGDQLKKVNVGLTAGSGFEYRFSGNMSAGLEGRYVHGLTNLARNGGSWKTRDIQVMAGLSFGF